MQKPNIHPVNATAFRYHGQILTCGYGHRWPLSFYTKGKVKMDHVWKPTRAEAEAYPA